MADPAPSDWVNRQGAHLERARGGVWRKTAEEETDECLVTDAGLQSIIDHWPLLDERTRGRILGLIDAMLDRSRPE